MKIICKKVIKSVSLWSSSLMRMYPIITPHVSTPAYEHICLYPGHKHMCLYPVDILQSVSKSIKFKITVIPLILLQITFAQATFFIKLRFLSLWCVWNTEFWANFTQIIKLLELKLTYLCFVWTTYHTVPSF